MDPKSTARSKRIHSLQGRRNHPTTSAAAKKKSSAPAGGAPHQHQKLSSNWDRYGDDPDEIEENQGDEMGILPKSKGADFGFLIEQARTQEQRVSSSSPEEFSFDIFQGSSFMMSARGETLLNWCEDDNFIVDDDSAPNYEVSSLSMDLKALALQLSKLKMSQRLLMEDFLFSDELSGSKSVKQVEEFDIQSHDKTLDLAEPGIGFSDQIAVEMVDSLKEERNTISNNAIIDDDLDDLLAETSGSFEEKVNNKMAPILDGPVDDLLGRNLMDDKVDEDKIEPTRPVVDDFDSWFDSL